MIENRTGNTIIGPEVDKLTRFGQTQGRLLTKLTDTKFQARTKLNDLKERFARADTVRMGNCFAEVSWDIPWDVAVGLTGVAEANNCLKNWENALKNSESKITLNKVEPYLKNLNNLKVQNEKLSGGVSGRDIEFSSKKIPNSIYRSNKGDRIYITDNNGTIFLDIMNYSLGLLETVMR
ncbi:MAG: hypothetical protein H7230_04155 [Candidatus Parcubacteria bacterium]|nr:hypothetical protein [Candidatus Paceibacterota bacterium]